MREGKQGRQVRRQNLKSLLVVLFVEVSFSRSSEGVRRLDVTADVRRKRIPMFTSFCFFFRIMSNFNILKTDPVWHMLGYLGVFRYDPPRLTLCGGKERQTDRQTDRQTGDTHRETDRQRKRVSERERERNRERD